MSPSIPLQLNSLSSHVPSPPVFNFLTFHMCGIGYNEFPHFFHTPFQAHIFPMFGILANAVFLTSIPKFLTFSSHWNLLPRTTCYTSSHFLMWGKGFLTFPQPIVNFLTFCLCRIGYNEFPHIFPHTRSWKIKWKILYIFPMCGISANTLFLTSILHMRKIPHIFLTLNFHSDIIVRVRAGQHFRCYVVAVRRRKTASIVCEFNCDHAVLARFSVCSSIFDLFLVLRRPRYALSWPPLIYSVSHCTNRRDKCHNKKKKRSFPDHAFSSRVKDDPKLGRWFPRSHFRLHCRL